MEFRNAKNECGLGNVHVRSFQSIINYLVCSLLGVGLLRMMESLLGVAGIAVPRLLERFRLALQGVLYDTRIDGESAALESMIPTGSGGVPRREP